MIISFFEEYPTKESLAKLKLVSFPTKLYIAAHSLHEFNLIKSRINPKNVKEIIYWPLLKKAEGYWMSPFSDAGALRRVMEETKSADILWDAELPFRRMLIVKNLPYFHKNKRMIREFFLSHKGKLYCAEYFPERGLLYLLLKTLGLEFKAGEYGDYEVKMLYSSMHAFSKGFMKKEIKRGVAEGGERFIPAFGVIEKGARGDEKQILPETLKRDLSIAKNAGAREVIIYRLGGLTKEHAAAIAKYAK